MNEMFSPNRLFRLWLDEAGTGGAEDGADDAALDAAAKAEADAKAAADKKTADGAADQGESDEEEDTDTVEFKEWLEKQSKAVRDRYAKMPKDAQEFYREQTSGLRGALKKERGLSKDARTRLKELEAAETTRKKAAMTDLERAQTELKEANESLTKTQEDLKKHRIESKVLFEAAKMRFVDAEDAMKLIDQSALKVEDDGSVTGVEDALKKLAKSKPHLLEPEQKGDKLGNAIRGGSKKASDGVKPAVKPKIAF